MKIPALILAGSLLAAPAFADKMTIKFEPTGADAVTIVLDSATGNMTMGDKTTTFTWDEATLTLCGAMEDGPLCATFAEKKSEVGESTTYKATSGNSGTATIIALEKAE